MEVFTDTILNKFVCICGQVFFFKMSVNCAADIRNHFIKKSNALGTSLLAVFETPREQVEPNTSFPVLGKI